ncbi:MAG: hypothetical protein GC168_11595 [Candidatus Hydrogenedens sp.]|nr:hypothetical protein [Candidatus Hydrogenedens sp.]
MPTPQVALDSGRMVRQGLAFLVLGAATACLTVPFWPGAFLADDLTLVHAGRAMVTDDFLRPFTGAWVWHDIAPTWAFPEYYRPLLLLTYGLDWLLWGFQPDGYNATNLLLHLVATLLVWRLAAALADDKRTGPPLLAAALFALFPGHDYDVLWISGRGDILCTVFVLLSLLGLLRWLRTGRGWHGGAHLLFAVLAFATKENAFALPVLAGLLVLYERRDAWAERDAPALVVPLLPTGLAAVLFAAARMAMFGAERALPGGPGLAGAPVALYQFLRNLTLPFHLSVQEILSDYPVAVPVALGVLAGLLWCGIHYHDKARLVLFGGLALGALLPTYSAFMPWYLYLPSVGVCLLLAELLSGARASRHLRHALAAVVLAAYAGGWMERGPEWREAGHVARAFVAEYVAVTSKEPEAQVVLYTVPGALNAIPIYFHNLFAALELEPGVFDKAPEIVAHIDATGNFPEAFSLSRENNTLSVSARDSFFLLPLLKDAPEPWCQPNIKSTMFDARGLVTAFEYQECASPWLSLVYDETGLHRLDNPRQL